MTKDTNMGSEIRWLWVRVPRGPPRFDKGKYTEAELTAEPLTAAFDGNGLEEQLIHPVRRLTLRQRHHVPVGVHRDGDSGMAKGFHHHAR
jgi:hypothetical protein